MKGLLAAFLIAFLLMPTLAAAKTVVYVSGQSCGWQECSCLTGEDRFFCTRLKDMGYDVVIDTETDVRNASSAWAADSKKADMIFLGDVSNDAIDKGANQKAFCGNVSTAGKKVFATFGSAYKNRTLYGCAFEMGIASYPSQANDNACLDDTVTITDANYITKGHNLNDRLQVYTESAKMKINYGTTVACADCHPESLADGLYSVMATANKGTFWGLDKPSKYANATWQLFERAVLLTMGDDRWNITYFTIPQNISAGKTFMLFANVKSMGRTVTTANINVSAAGSSLGKLTYNAETGYWENRALVIPAAAQLTITADEGSKSDLIRTGDLDVRILSGTYTPGKTYSAKAKVLLQGTEWPAAVTYKMWDSNLTLRAQGDMTNLQGTYYADLNLGYYGNFILEVTAVNVSYVGGAFKTVVPQTAALNYSVEPSEWVTTATKAGSETMDFVINAGSQMSGIRADKSGDLAGLMTIDTAVTDANVGAGNSTHFRVKLDWSSLREGTYTSELYVESDQTTITVPVVLYYYKVSGNWLEAEPKVLKVAVPAGKTGKAKITLTNTGSLPTTGLGIEAKGDVAGKVSMPKNPHYINASKAKDVELVFDASGMSEGKYDGTVTFTSTLGRAEVAVDWEVGTDIAPLLDTLESDWYDQLARLTEGGAALTSSAAQLSQSINGTLAAARAANNAGDYTLANQQYQSALANLERLKKEGKEGPNLLLIAIIVVVIGFVAYAGFRLIRARKKQAPQPQIPSGEEGYRTEYY